MNGQACAITGLLENFPVSAWMIDDNQYIVYMNSCMRELFGDLTGQKTSIIYECGSFEVLKPVNHEEGGSSEVIISEVPFRRLSSFVDLGEDGRFSVDLFEDISEQKSRQSHMEHALSKLHTEIKMAKTIQNSILPVDDVYWDTVSFSSLYVPADDLGGDFFDLLKLNEDEFLIYIADVTGHGIQASLMTVFMRECVRTNIEAANIGTAELIGNLVRDFCMLDIEASMYVTMTLCKYTKSRRELSISNAGHSCFPLIVRNSGRTEVIPTRGMPVCVLAEGIDYEEEIVGIKPGDRLILFTDGIVEEVDAMTGLSFGPEGVRELAEKFRDFHGSYLARKIMDASDRFALISAKDDRSIVVADFLS